MNLSVGEWLALIGVVAGFIGWLTGMFVRLGKILQEMKHLSVTLVSIRKALDSHDDRIQDLNIRVTKLESAK